MQIGRFGAVLGIGLLLLVAGVGWAKAVRPVAGGEAALPGFFEVDVPTAAGFPAQIAVDGQGRVWVTERDANKVARFDPQTGLWQEHELLTPSSQPWGLAVDSQDRIWIAERDGNQVVRIDPTGPDPDAWPETAYAAAGPHDVAIGGGGIVWFTEPAAGKLGKLLPDTGQVFEYAVAPPGAVPGSLAVAGWVWLVETLPECLGLFEPPEGPSFGLTLPAGLILPQDIAVNSDGAPWITDVAANKIALFDPSTMSLWLQIDVPTAGSEPYGIAVAADGSVWFTERQGNKLGRYRGALPLVEFPLPTAGSLPTGIAVDQAGCAWYTAPGANRIGRLCLHRRWLPAVFDGYDG